MPNPMMAAEGQAVQGLWGAVVSQHSTHRNTKASRRPTHGAPHARASAPGLAPGQGAGAARLPHSRPRPCASARASATPENPLPLPLTPRHNTQHSQRAPLLPPTPPGPTSLTRVHQWYTAGTPQRHRPHSAAAGAAGGKARQVPPPVPLRNFQRGRARPRHIPGLPPCAYPRCTSA